MVYITTTQILVTKDNPSHLLYCIMILFKSHAWVLHIYKCKCAAVQIKCTGRSRRASWMELSMIANPCIDGLSIGMEHISQLTTESLVPWSITPPLHCIALFNFSGNTTTCHHHKLSFSSSISMTEDHTTIQYLVDLRGATTYT